MKIRLMKQSDFDKVYTLWQKTGSAVEDYQTEQKEFTMLIQLNPNACLVALKENKIIGSVLGGFDGRRAWIYHLAVDPLYQRKGIGSTLLAKAEEGLRQNGATIIRLWVMYSNLKFFPFYQKNGYGVINKSLLFGKSM